MVGRSKSKDPVSSCTYWYSSSCHLQYFQITVFSVKQIYLKTFDINVSYQQGLFERNAWFLLFYYRVKFHKFKLTLVEKVTVIPVLKGTCYQDMLTLNRHCGCCLFGKICATSRQTSLSAEWITRHFTMTFSFISLTLSHSFMITKYQMKNISDSLIHTCLITTPLDRGSGALLLLR